MSMRWQLKLKRYVCHASCGECLYFFPLNGSSVNIIYWSSCGLDWDILQLYDLAYLKAKGMLQKNRRVLEKIVEELLEFEILSGKVKDVTLKQFKLLYLL